MPMSLIGFGAFTPSAGAGGTPSTWSPSDKAADITLSGGNLIATHATGTAYANVRGTDGKTTGKYYSEHTIAFFAASQVSIGVANASASLTNYGGQSTNTVAVYMDGTVYYNDGLVTTIQSTSTGQRVDMAVDLTNGKIWWRTNNGNWNNSGTADPATNTEGITISPTGTLFPMASLRSNVTPDSNTAVFQSTSWAGTAPSGFGQWSS